MSDQADRHRNAQDVPHPDSPAGQYLDWASLGVPHPNSPAGLAFDWKSLGVPHPHSPVGHTSKVQVVRHREKPQSQKTQQDLLDELHPVFRARVDSILADLRNLGWEPVIVFARRTREQQQDAIRRGASRTMLSWHVQDTIGLLGSGRSQLQVVRGNAVDIVDRRYGWEGKAKDQNFQFWKDLGAAAHSHDCQWGGDWKHRDVAHVQMFFTEEPAQDSFTA